MPLSEDKPTEEFLATLKAFEPFYATVCCVKEMAELLLILSDAPMYVRDGIDGFLSGTYLDKKFNHSIDILLHSDGVSGTCDGQSEAHVPTQPTTPSVDTGDQRQPKNDLYASFVAWSESQGIDPQSLWTVAKLMYGKARLAAREEGFRAEQESEEE